MCLVSKFICFFFKQKTAYEMRISDWSSDVCSSDLRRVRCEAEPIVIQHLIHGTMRGQGMKQSRWKIVDQSWCRLIAIRENTIWSGSGERISSTKPELVDYRMACERGDRRSVVWARGWSYG